MPLDPTDPPAQRSSPSPSAPLLPPSPPARSPRRTILSGVWILLGSCMLLSMPLLLGRWEPNKYLVAFGFIGACVGASTMLHGTWDALIERRRSRR